MTRLRTCVTFLEMRPPFAPSMQCAWPMPMRFARESYPDLEFYLRLYRAVGERWHWIDRTKLDDATLATIIHHRDNHFLVLRHDDATETPIGFAEVNLRNLPQAEIVLFGVIDSIIGKGFGRAMLNATLSYIHSFAPDRIIIQTCTLDHPRALLFYQRVGFIPYQRKFMRVPQRATL